MRLFGELAKFVEIAFDGRIFSECKTCLLSFLFSFFADEVLDGPDDWVKQSPFDFLKDIAHRSFIIELPGKKNTEGKRAGKNRQTIEEIEIDFWSNMKPDNESTKLLETEVCPDLLSILAEVGMYELTCQVDVQGDEDFIDDWDLVIWILNCLLVRSISTSKDNNHNTESIERYEFD